MKLVYPDIDCVFDTQIDKINTIVIENPHLLCALISDLQTQLAGGEGRAVLSADGKFLPVGRKSSRYWIVFFRWS